MSISVAVVGYIAAGAAVAGAGYSAYESHEQGEAVKAADTRKARIEAQAETQKQITMRQNMLRALASQNAGTLGAVGTSGNTSFGANATRQITQGQNDLLVSQANSSGQTSLLDQAGNNAVQEGNAQGIGTVLKAVGSYASGGG